MDEEEIKFVNSWVCHDYWTHWSAIVGKLRKLTVVNASLFFLLISEQILSFVPSGLICWVNKDFGWQSMVEVHWSDNLWASKIWVYQWHGSIINRLIYRTCDDVIVRLDSTVLCDKQKYICIPARYYYVKRLGCL